MRILVDGLVGTENIPNRFIGLLDTPRSRNDPQTAIDRGVPWAMDNSAFSDFNEKWFINRLKRNQHLETPLWVTAPDVVGNAVETLSRFHHWKVVIKSYSYPVALVAQDGIENTIIPWADFDALFIGGSTSFKLGKVVRHLIANARHYGKCVHMGRVNSKLRLRYAQSLSCDTVDGSGYSKWRYKLLNHLPYLINEQPLLIEVECEYKQSKRTYPIKKEPQ